MIHKTPHYFEIHKTFYIIKVNYSLKIKKIKITVQVNTSNEIFFILISQQQLPLQLAFYRSIDNIYLALQRSKLLSFNIQKKCFQLQDLINNKPTKINLPMKKRKLRLLQLEHKRRSKKYKLYKQQVQQIKQLRLRYGQASKNVESLISMVKQGQKQILLQQNQLKAERHKLKEMQIQNEQLRQFCRFNRRRFPELTKEFDIFMKRRKDSDTSYSKAQTPSSQLTKEMIIEEQNNDSKAEIQLLDEYQQSEDSFLLQIDQAEFQKALYIKK